ncbi:hypothetical protein PanWU01x14_041070 [Parasponia andersonii]|uniref:Aspartic peptidase domain containing protein n=1 Tax=Parasponia andersonii TaxID=3476 RepID=A0A2P5DQA0_PARAD|nr:hypothetical protein PanWU01x14_041070 [Parasponia andersonii]
MRDLDRLEQTVSESPKEYLTRFLEVISLVHNADSVQAASLFVRGLVLESRQKTSKVSVAITTAPAQALVPYGVKRPAPDRGPILKQGTPTQGSQEGGKKRKVSCDPLPKYELNTPIDMIYLQKKDKGIFKDQPKSGIPEHMKNRNRYYQFHKYHEHDTINYRNFYTEVMVSIHAGKLNQYVKTGGIQLQVDATRPEKSKQTQASRSGDQALRIVPTIVDRSEQTQGQEEKEKCLRKTEERMKRLRGMGHSVNHLRIDSALVGRVLIDGGSSVNILFLRMFENMGLNRNALRPICQLLFAFDSTKVSPLGVVILKVCAAERCLDVDFVVIDCPSSFNIIMGRGWIQAMHGVASTLHQVLRYLSKDDTYTIDIKGDQASARKYFSPALKGPDASTNALTGDE